MKSSVRALLNRPLVSAVVVLTFALGIGANAAIFSVVSAVVLRPLPAPDSDRLVHVFENRPRGSRFEWGGDKPYISVRPGTYHDWKEMSESFDRLSCARFREALLFSERALSVDGQSVCDGFFETLGVPPLLGRTFSPQDYEEEGVPVVVLSHALFREQFGADENLVGRDILLDGTATRVVGVMPDGFFPNRWSKPRFWTPLRFSPETRTSRVQWGLVTYGRLKPGVTLERAQEEMHLLEERIGAAHPDDYQNMGAVVAPLSGYLFGHHERLFALLLGAVLLVLSIACANAASLMLAQSRDRAKEWALRAALGATRGRLARQALLESLLLACAGGLAGLVLAVFSVPALLALIPASSRIARIETAAIDLPVLLFTFLLSLLTGSLFGLAPALGAARSDLSRELKASGRRAGDLLAIAEIAFSMVLLVGAALLLQSFFHLVRSDPGFRPERVLAMWVSVPDQDYGTYQTGGENPARIQLFEELERRVREVPGVQAAALTASLPLKHLPNPWAISIEGRPEPAPDAGGRGAFSRATGLPIHGDVSIQRVSPGYFETLRVPLLRGRGLDERDRPGQPMAALLNETAVRKYFPDEDPIGKRITIDMTSYFPQVTVVGVAADSRLNGLDRDVHPQIFWPMAQLPSQNAWLLLRTSSESSALAEAVVAELARINGNLAASDVRPMSEVLSESLWMQRVTAVLLVGFAFLALAIAAAGVFAVVSHSVSRRRKELAVRVAVGAGSREIYKVVLGQGLRIGLAGAALGAVASVLTSRTLESHLHGVPARDPTTLVLLASMTVILAVLASSIPAHRAVRVDPARVIRGE
jgi:putative ABC transport system permease protein